MKIIKTKEAWEQERGILTGKSIGMVPHGSVACRSPLAGTTLPQPERHHRSQRIRQSNPIQQPKRPRDLSRTLAEDCRLLGRCKRIIYSCLTIPRCIRQLRYHVYETS